MQDLIRTGTLEDGSEVTVRARTSDDFDACFEFYQAIPDSEKLLMRVDVTDRQAVEDRWKDIERSNAGRLIAVRQGKVIGEAVLEQMRYGWLRKTGEIRIIALPEYCDTPVVNLLAKEIFLLAARSGLNHILSRVLDGEAWLINILKKLYFEHQATQRLHAVDHSGEAHDVLVMTFSLHKMWEGLEEAIEQSISSPREY